MIRIHFIAIGGAAMHNLALAVASKAGYQVTGSDDEIFDPALTHLREAGLLPDEMGWHPERITKDIDAIILGMHAREDSWCVHGNWGLRYTPSPSTCTSRRRIRFASS